VLRAHGYKTKRAFLPVAKQVKVKTFEKLEFTDGLTFL